MQQVDAIKRATVEPQTLKNDKENWISIGRLCRFTRTECSVEAANWSHLFTVIKLKSQLINVVMIYWCLKDNTGSFISPALQCTWSWAHRWFCLRGAAAGFTPRSSQPPIVFKNPLMGTVFMFSITVHGYIRLLAAMKCQNKNLRQEWQENLGGDSHWFLHFRFQ